MGVKKKSSEYQHAFKSVYPCFTATYEKNYDYRTNRRLTEHNHQVDPFDWDPPSESGSESGICVSNGGPRVAKQSPSVPLHIYKHEKFNKSYRDRLNQLTQQLAQNVQVSLPQTALVQDEADDIPLSARSRDSGVQTDKVEQVDRAVNGSVQVYPRDLPTDTPAAVEDPKPKVQSQKKEVLTTSHPRRPVYKPVPSSRSPRASSAPPAKGRAKKVPSIALNKSADKPPFVSYGCLDDERSVTKKLTYNVRASAEVHPSALLAKKRRQVDTAKKSRVSKSASEVKTKKRAYYDDFNVRTKRETSQWDTEYRSHYAGYERGIYEQNLSARPVTRIHDPQLLVTTW